MSADTDRAELKSTTLAKAEYWARTAQLLLDFRDRSRYIYFGVPNHLFTALLQAPSHGAFFNREIRNRYAYVRIA
jgi:hypothetical protein